MKPMMIEASRLDILPVNEPKYGHENEAVAVIPVYGFLSQYSTNADFFFAASTSYEDIEYGLNAALAAPEIDKIILNINSPGGEVSGLFELCDLIREASKKKQIEAIANDDAFSAAYAIASSADKVWLTKTAGIGSIGVIATHVDQSLYDQKEGFKITPVFAGSHKNDLSPHEPLSESAMKAMQGEIDRLYGLFVEIVAKNRGLTTQAVRDTEAALFFGESAISAGLADGFATLRGLISSPRELSNIATIPPTFSTINNKRRVSMSKNVIDKNEEVEIIESENLPEVEPEDATQEEGNDDKATKTQKEPDVPIVAKSDVLELVKLSKIAKRPELLGFWLEKGFTTAQAQEALLQEMESTPDIISVRHTVVAPLENPLISAAKKRIV